MIAIPGTILVSGNLVHDTLVSPVSEIRFGATSWVDRIEGHMGGNGANSSYAAALLSAPVRLLGMVGNDLYGESIRQRLRGAGVDISLLETGRDGTASSVVIVREDGARAFLHRPGVSREAFDEPFSLTREIARGCSHYHLANPFSLPHVRSNAGRLLREARELELTTSLDTAWDSRGEWMQVLSPCLPHLDVLFVNEDEAKQLTGSTEPEVVARTLQAAGVKSVVIKRGPAGAVLFDGADRLESEAFFIVPVDTTGAGDCFVGTFLAALHLGYSLGRTMKLANAAGARSAGAMGATTGLLTLGPLLAWAGM